MARMVATKTALSIRVDALTDADEKSEEHAPSVGLENRTKLESRLRALEHQSDMAGVRRFPENGKKQRSFSMKGDVKTYNTAADAVDLVPAHREPLEAAMQVVLDVKEEKRKAREEKKARQKVEKEKQPIDAGNAHEMDVDGEVKETKKERKRKRRESEGNDQADVEKPTVSVSVNASFLVLKLLLRRGKTVRQKRNERRGKGVRQRRRLQRLPWKGRQPRKRKRVRLDQLNGLTLLHMMLDTSHIIIPYNAYLGTSRVSMYVLSMITERFILLRR